MCFNDKFVYNKSVNYLKLGIWNSFFFYISTIEPKSNLSIMFNTVISKALLVTTTQLTMILIAVASIFLIFIIIAIVKMYKLKAENKKLMETNAFKDVDESYKDFTGGHLYGDN
jgi:hypothetical protein